MGFFGHDMGFKLVFGFGPELVGPFTTLEGGNTLVRYPGQILVKAFFVFTQFPMISVFVPLTKFLSEALLGKLLGPNG